MFLILKKPVFLFLAYIVETATSYEGLSAAYRGFLIRL